MDGPGPDRHRTFAVIGVEGLAPQRFSAELTHFISDEGGVSFHLEGTYELLLTQRLIAQSRFELDLAFSDASDLGIQSGFNDIGIGLRLRYEFLSKLAPHRMSNSTGATSLEIRRTVHGTRENRWTTSRSLRESVSGIERRPGLGA